MPTSDTIMHNICPFPCFGILIVFTATSDPAQCRLRTFPNAPCPNVCEILDVRKLHMFKALLDCKFKAIQKTMYVERSSSVVECRTRNRVSPGSNPPLLPFRRLGIFRSLHRRPCSLSCINEYLAIDSGGNVSDLVLARNC